MTSSDWCFFSFFQDKQSTPRALSLCVEETHRYLSLHLLLDAFPRFRRSAGALCLHRQRWLHRTGCFAVVEINAEDVNITTIRVGRNKEGRDQNSQCGGRWRACIYSGAARGSPRCSKARPQPQRYERAMRRVYVHVTNPLPFSLFLVVREAPMTNGQRTQQQHDLDVD